MRKVLTWIYIPLLVSTLLVFLVLSVANAVNIDISGNGAGSSNQVNYNSTQDTSIDQSNYSNVNNNVDVNCDTGGNDTNNSTGGNTGTSTGNCASNVNITNKANSNNADVSCPTCAKASPTPTPKASPSPVLNGRGGGTNPGPNGGGDGSSPSGGSSSNPQVLGSTGTYDATLIGGVGFFSIALGLWLVQKQLAKRSVLA